MANAEIIVRQPITEKTERLGTENRYVLEVLPDARKPQIAEAVEKKYGVHVLCVRTINVKGGKRYIRGTRRATVEATRKKAIVTLRAGERIEQV